MEFLRRFLKKSEADEAALAIGRVSMSWSRLEYFAHMLYGDLVGNKDREIGVILANEGNLRSHLTSIKHVVNHIEKASIAKNLVEPINLINNELRPIRNIYIHGLIEDSLVLSRMRNQTLRAQAFEVETVTALSYRNFVECHLLFKEAIDKAAMSLSYERFYFAQVDGKTDEFIDLVSSLASEARDCVAVYNSAMKSPGRAT